MIWIFGTRKDPQVAGVCDHLDENKVDYYIFDHLETTEHSILLEDGVPRVVRNNVFVPFPKLIWKRLKLNSFSRWVSEIERERKLYKQEWYDFYSSLVGISNCRIINEDIPKSRLTKISQAVSANKCGMKTPNTLFTTSHAETEEFLKKFNYDVIHKKPSPGGVAYEVSTESMDISDLKGSIVFTTTVTEDEFRNSSQDDFSFCPVFFQEKIEKDYELRILVIGTKIFPFSINSQDVEHAKTDWRLGTLSLSYQPAEIPRELEEKMFAFLKDRGLFYGSFDFVVTPSGDYVFLECNQDGQWAWLDQAVDGKISQTFAQQLIEISSKDVIKAA